MSDIFQKSAENYEPHGRLDPAGFKRHVTFHTYPPPDDLAQFVEHFWTIRWEGVETPYYSEEVMHRPYVDLFVSAPESGIQGTFRAKRTYVAAGSGRIVGIRYRPGAFHVFWDGRMADLQDQIATLAQVFPQMDGPYVESLLRLDDQAIIRELQDLLRAKQPQTDANIDLINAIIADIETDKDLPTVSEVAKSLARSERWLQQLFQDYVGIGIKWLIQRRRLLAAAKQIRETVQPDWIAIAYDLGYSNQQHFITDFKHVLGKTPLQYKKGLTV